MGLAELYREILLDHYRTPRNRGELADSSFQACEANPLCGDEVLVAALLGEGSIAEVRFQGRGCIISMASASLMTEHVRGRTIEEILEKVEQVRQMVEEDGPGPGGELEALRGVRDYPSRLVCALLAWRAIQKGIQQVQQSNSPVSGG